MRSQTRHAGQDAHSSAVTTSIGSEARNHGHVTVDLFQGWTTEPSTSSSSSVAQEAFQPEDTQVKRSLSQDEFNLGAMHATPIFQSIAFPKGDTSLATSLYTGFRDDDEEMDEAIKRLPPSKRPGVSHAKKTPPNHIKRPRNAYIIFRSHTVSQKLIPKEVENDHRNISRIIAHMWKSLAPEDRAHYEQIAKEEKERHKRLFPDYRYQPTTRRTGVSKRNVKKLENGEEECQEIADIILKAQGKEGVVVRPQTSKPAKRQREATRLSQPGEKNSTRKRTKTSKSAGGEPSTSPQVLETVFLRSSASTSPAAGGSAGTGAVSAPSPEPFRLVSTISAVDESSRTASAMPGPNASAFVERRASSVPPLRPCSPPQSFELSEQASLDGQHQREETQAPHGVSNKLFAHEQGDCPDQFVMPAPSWKGRRPQPPPIPNTWQHCSFDDQSLPSPRSFDTLGSVGKQLASRPRTAMPSTPSSGSFRGFFHPWAYDDGTETMLISPMTSSFQDLRRRSSIARSGLSAGRRPGSIAFDPHLGAGSRDEVTDCSAGLMSAYEPRLSDVDLFDQAARAAAISLETEGTTNGLEEPHVFQFDPALEAEGREPAITDSHQAEVARHEPPSDRTYNDLPRVRACSPRPSFSGSTLAAAARDWTSMKRRRSRVEDQSSVFEPLDNSGSKSGRSTAHGGQSSPQPLPPNVDKPLQHKPTLEESVERAVMLALGKDSGQGAEGSERNSRIVQQIMSSLSADLALPQLAACSTDLEHRAPLSNTFADLSERPMGNKVPSPYIEPARRAALRAPCASAPSLRSHFFAGATPADAHAVSKPLPSPLQLVMSNHDMPSDPSYHIYSASQHQPCI